MDIKLGITGHETTFEYAIVNNAYQVHGTTHTTASGAKRIQYAKEDKFLFTIILTFCTEAVWTSLMAEVRNSKLYDLNFIDGEGDNYSVRIVPESIPKMPILGTAQGYDITFNLQEV